MAWDLQDFALFIGLDVGKSEHHATALTTTGEKAYDKPLPNDEAKIQDLLGELTPVEYETVHKDAVALAA